jgi:hypothetical protein
VNFAGEGLGTANSTRELNMGREWNAPMGGPKLVPLRVGHHPRFFNIVHDCLAHVRLVTFRCTPLHDVVFVPAGTTVTTVPR